MGEQGPRSKSQGPKQNKEDVIHLSVTWPLGSMHISKMHNASTV